MTKIQQLLYWTIQLPWFPK